MKVLKPSEIKEDANIFVVIGSVGTGKTSLVNSHEGRKLVLSFDSSYSTLKDDGNLTVIADIETNELLETSKFLNELSKIANGYDLVVFDNISALSENVIYDLTQGIAGRNKDGRAAYKSVQDILHAIANWAVKFKGDVLFTAWSKVVDGYEVAQLNETAFTKVAGYAKVVGRTFVNGDYKVSMSPSLEGIGKNRVNKVKETPNGKFWKAVKYREKEVVNESNQSQSKQ